MYVHSLIELVVYQSPEGSHIILDLGINLWLREQGTTKARSESKSRIERRGSQVCDISGTNLNGQ